MSKKRKSANKKVRQNPNNRGIAMIGISLVVIMLMAVLLVQGFSLNVKIAKAEAREEQLEDQLIEEKNRTEEIEKTKEYMNTHEYIEKAARDNGLAKDNEIIFKEVE